MPTEGSVVEKDQRDYRLAANTGLVAAIVMMICCELNTILGLSSKAAPHGYRWNLYTVPIFIVVPLLLLLIYRMQAKRWIAQGKIARDFAVRISTVFSAALMSAYICILFLSELAFNAR